jgi:hypothetical protein
LVSVGLGAALDEHLVVLFADFPVPPVSLGQAEIGDTKHTASLGQRLLE